MICIFTWPTKKWFVSNLMVSHWVDDIEGVSSVTIVIFKGILLWTNITSSHSNQNETGTTTIIYYSLLFQIHFLFFFYFTFVFFFSGFLFQIGLVNMKLHFQVVTVFILSTHLLKITSKFYQIYYLLICLFAFHIYCGCNRLLLKFEWSM
jgi:hypothetical protein